jgi:hypothetical protein
MWWSKDEFYIGKVIHHYGRFKQVFFLTEEYIETKYVVPNSSGWCKVEKLFIKDLTPPSVEDFNEMIKQELNKFNKSVKI